MSTIKVDTIATRTGSGNITLSNSLASATIAGDLTVDTNALKVDASSNTVGIRNTSSGALQAVNGRPGLVVGDTSGARGIAILTSATGAGSLLFANATSGTGAYRGYIEYDHNGNRIDTYINSSVHAQRIHSDGVISIPQGIELGSGVDKTAANTLDDYEEGTFTPSIGGTGVAYGTQTGVYRKIGNLVYVYLQIAVNTIGSPATTNQILGLPFAPAISNQHFGIEYYNAITNNTYELHGNFRSDSSIRVEGKGSFGPGQTSGMNWAQNNAAIYGSGCYYTS